MTVLAFAIYKKGQGYWTRMLSAISAGILLLACLAWLYQELSVIKNADVRTYVQLGVWIVGIAVFGGLIAWIMNKPKIVDFYIATEVEMRKVNWPTQRELIGSTWIVICGTFMLTFVLWVINIVFAWFFQAVGVLEKG